MKCDVFQDITLYFVLMHPTMIYHINKIVYIKQSIVPFKYTNKMVCLGNCIAYERLQAGLYHI